MTYPRDKVFLGKVYSYIFIIIVSPLSKIFVQMQTLFQHNNEWNILLHIM